LESSQNNSEQSPSSVSAGASLAAGLTQLKMALARHQQHLQATERAKRRQELLQVFCNDYLPQICSVLQAMEQALMEVHHFTRHIQKRVQELQEWTTIKNEEEEEEAAAAATDERKKLSKMAIMTLASLRPPQLVKLIESVQKAWDDSEEAQHKLDLFLLKQRRGRASRRRQPQQGAVQTSGGSNRLQELQREACVKAATYNSLVCQLAQVAVTHFPELLVAPSVQSQNDTKGEDDEEEEEEEEEESAAAALWHLLHNAWESDGLVVAGRRLQHYTDVVRLATAGFNARHDVYRACLLHTNPNAPNRSMPVVLKKYVLQSDRNSRTMGRFLRETRLLHLMKHPNIAEIRAVFFDQEEDTNSSSSTMGPEGGGLSSFDVSSSSSSSSSSSNGQGRVVSAYIEMPFYGGGTLDKWLDCNRELLTLEKLKMLSRELLRALKHLHAHGVVHCDVKPQNVLMTTRGVDASARLSDFDVSYDNNERAQALMATVQRTVAFSLNFAAPELLLLPQQCQQQDAPHSIMAVGATAASDMFSLGLVLVHMFFGPKKLPSVSQLASGQPIPLPRVTDEDDRDGGDDNNEAAFVRLSAPGSGGSGIQQEREQLERLLDLVSLLLQVEPTKRPTAMQALSHAFFTRAEQAEQVQECTICLSAVLQAQGVRCDASAPSPSHFTCNKCFDRHVLTESRREVRLLQRDNGHVRCPGASAHLMAESCGGGGGGDGGGKSSFFSDDIICQHTSTATFGAYMEARKQLVEQQLAQEMEHHHKTALRQEIERLRVLSAHQLEVEGLVQAVREDVLTLKCPRCGQAFVDFEGCFALKCSRCAAAFCGWCLEDCGTNAHPHVVCCRRKLSDNNYFGSVEQFKAAHKQRRIQQLHELLNNQKDQVRRDVLHEVSLDLRHLDILPEDFGL